VAAPLAQGLAGVCLLAYRVFVGYDPVGLSTAANVLAVAWGLTAGLVGRRYVVELVGAGARRTLGALEVRGRIRQESGVAAGLEVLEQRLKSDQPGDVLYCLELLDESEYQRLEQALVRLLEHPVPAVRVEALRRIERRKLAGTIDAVLALMERETVPAVRAAALGAMAMTETAEATERLRAAVQDPDLEVRVAALVAILRYGGENGDAEAREKLRAMAFSRVEEDRMLAARAIGEAGVKQLHFAIGALLRDASVPVRRAALTAAGQLDVSDLWPRVVQRLADPETMRAAATALIQAGPTAMPFLMAAFGMAATPRAQRLSIVRLCGRIRDEDALELLVKNIDHPDAELRRQVLRALDACEFRATSEAWQARIQKLVASEVKAGAWISAAQRDLEGGIEGLELPEYARNTFASELDFARERALLLLSFVYESKAITRCAGLLLGGDAGRRAYALEILDNVLPHAVKETLFPLLEELPPERRLAALGGSFRQPRMTPRERIRDLVACPLAWVHPWTLASWVHTAGTLGLAELRPELEQAVMSPAPLVAETARWAVKALRGGAETVAALPVVPGAVAPGAETTSTTTGAGT
jgi:HEAT repeat protein